MKYLIGSGYHDPEAEKQDLFELWYTNTLKHTRKARLFVLADSGSIPPRQLHGSIETTWIEGDLGNHLDLLEGRKPYAFNGWSGAVCLCALMAYCDEADFIWKEQDCLAFGPWVEKLYAEIGEAGIIFGGPIKNGELEMPCAQSLFLVKHAFIPKFVSLYLGSAAQNVDEELGEKKFARFMAADPANWKQFSFGYDRSRPFNVKDEVFYLQQITPEEMAELRAAGLI